MRQNTAPVSSVCGKQSIRLSTECDNRAVAHIHIGKPEGQTTFRLVSQSFLRYEHEINFPGYFYKIVMYRLMFFFVRSAACRAART